MFPEKNATLVLSEYGTDVEASKKLCRDHGLINNVLWIPPMPRMYLLEIISKCDIGLGEFYSVPKMIYGGTALEIMACGKPLIQGFLFEQGPRTFLFSRCTHMRKSMLIQSHQYVLYVHRMM